ncbi:hypothetical protein TI39_contig375g00008 [Zymoseptoria brevis]|uniref:Myb-like domain-containing protein n=1 Tax=Zymoseptoria brevis TaxID=1047168 RepID=A0A0F4GNU4_9PEZI|nr:hypothetical protein TI39_contig375g00008 [Zymoseptoria brevis]
MSDTATPKKSATGWTEAEKLGILFQVIEKAGPIPWAELTLPEGRTQKACQVMVDKEKKKVRDAKAAAGEATPSGATHASTTTPAGKGKVRPPSASLSSRATAMETGGFSLTAAISQLADQVILTEQRRSAKAAGEGGDEDDEEKETPAKKAKAPRKKKTPVKVKAEAEADEGDDETKVEGGDEGGAKVKGEEDDDMVGV